MSCYAVIYHGSLLAVLTSAVDAAEVAKHFPGCSVQLCKLNALTPTGRALMKLAADSDATSLLAQPLK